MEGNGQYRHDGYEASGIELRGDNECIEFIANYQTLIDEFLDVYRDRRIKTDDIQALVKAFAHMLDFRDEELNKPSIVDRIMLSYETNKKWSMERKGE